MACPDARQLEELISGSLSTQDQDELLKHLSQCSDCAREVSAMSTIRLSLAETEQTTSAEGPDCLTDEAISAFADGELSGLQRQQMSDHLATCEHCRSTLVNLDRALASLPKEEMAPPLHVLNQAIRMGAPGRSAQRAEASQATSKKTLFDRIFGESLAWRLTMASSAAGLALLLTVLLTQGPELDQGAPEPSPGLNSPTRLALNQDKPSIPKSVPDPVPAPENEIDPKADKRPEIPGKGATERDENARLAQNQSTLAKHGYGLARKVQPSWPMLQRAPGTALIASPSRPTFGTGFLLGRSHAFLKRFGSQITKSAEMQDLLSQVLHSVSTACRTAQPGNQSASKLSSFADKLADQIASGELKPTAASRRLAVFTQALGEHLASNKTLKGGFETGVLVQAWNTSAHSAPTEEALPANQPSSDEIERARTLIRTARGIDPKERSAALSNLSSLEKLGSEPPEARRSTRILDDLSKLNRNLSR